MSEQKTRRQIVDEEISEILGFDKKPIDLEAKLEEELGMDSLDHIEIIMAIEEALDFEIPDEHLEGKDRKCLLASMKDIYAYLDKRLGPETPGDDNYLPLTDAQFDDRYRPETTRDGGSYIQREWYEPKDKILIEQAIQDKRCWTAVDGDNGEFVILWGNRTVNRLYNIITARPIENEDWHVEVTDPDQEMPDEEE